ISDQQFYPCKCGYQICMWCWHKIKETENGKCPACRTDYGDNPHEFSEVDLGDVVKAQKEKKAQDKLTRQSQSRPTSDSAAPKPLDRASLANMRVIRRNLVYCVGLPPSMSSSETLKSASHFGQYGRITKVVLNRTPQINAGPRGAPPPTTSAYVTFHHPLDALCCILSLDGFYLDNRNVRCSYGTSKYCSAFIKNVRCNNPDCTYLHYLGSEEDTFTKQEIQAGYVTSGRDQAQKIITGKNRVRVGGGGVSGTGKSPPPGTAVLPPPKYDETLRPTSGGGSSTAAAADAKNMSPSPQAGPMRA
ncbi:hypothetical protein TrRE_jg7466, partial [Triparma retinervis]